MAIDINKPLAVYCVTLIKVHSNCYHATNQMIKPLIKYAHDLWPLLIQEKILQQAKEANLEKL